MIVPRKTSVMSAPCTDARLLTVHAKGIVSDLVGTTKVLRMTTLGILARRQVCAPWWVYRS